MGHVGYKRILAVLEFKHAHHHKNRSCVRSRSVCSAYDGVS